MKPRVRLALIGSDQQDNLAVGYLAAAAADAGVEVVQIRFDSAAFLDECVEAVLAAGVEVVGLSIRFQASIRDHLELARALRRRGYEGHITCGGHPPTFCYREILRDAPEIDSVIRHEGEATLVELLERLRDEDERGLAGVTGTVWRDGSAVVVEPARPLERELERIRPPARRESPMTIGAVRVAFVITSRGCTGDCRYCSIRAFGRDAGGPAYRLRSADAVADEVATLYHRDGVRVFFVQDDLFILPNEAATLSRLGGLTAALRRRGVDEARFWIKGRPESITPAVLDAASELGTVHLFIGLESASSSQLVRLGRTHVPADNERALELCREREILPSFNFMLFDPDGTLDDVSASLDLASRNLDLPWNVCRTEVYPGTRLMQSLHEQGRLEGDYASHGYRMADEHAEVMFRVMRVCFHDRAFDFDSLLNRLIALSFARQTQQAFFAGARTDALAREVDELMIAVHADTVDRMRRYVDFAASTRLEEVDPIRRFAVAEGLEVSSVDVAWRGQYRELWRRANLFGATLTPPPSRRRRQGAAPPDPTGAASSSSASSCEQRWRVRSGGA